MGDIKRFGPWFHYRGTPTTYVRQLRNGRAAREGAGLAFWFRPLGCVLSEVPIDDRELAFTFRGRTRDFQEVTVQATVTFRVAEPGTAIGRIDFGIDPATGQLRNRPLDQVGGMLTELAQQYAIDLLADLDLTEAIVRGPVVVRDGVTAGLVGDARLAEVGIAVIGVRITGVVADPEVQRALQTPTRESVQGEADRATYERRALAVERERAIAENELANRIELARREETLVAQQGANDRRRAEETAAAQEVAVAAEADRTRVLADAEAYRTTTVGEAEATAEAGRLAAVADIDAAKLLALALRELGGQLPEIGQLTVTPDVLTGLLGRLG
ncbi:SPFH domain-containing protein [Nocardioides maradonensis]